jgi:hypothetical protein
VTVRTSRFRPTSLAILAVVLAIAGLSMLPPQTTRAAWMQPDESYREAQLWLRAAIRDTLHHADDPIRLDSLGVALMRLGRFDDARDIFERSLAIEPQGFLARSGLGKIALFRNELEEALAYLEEAARVDDAALNDLFAARIRAGQYKEAADMAADVNQIGRTDLLLRMAQGDTMQITAKKPESRIHWKRSYPVPLVPVKLNGTRVLMAIDTGANELIIDDSAARRHNVEQFPSRRRMFWTGSMVAVRNAMVQTLEIGNVTIRNVPASEVSLRKWSLEVNPRGQRVAGIIGLDILRRLQPTMDYKKHTLTLRTEEAPFQPGPSAMIVPFELWGENEMMVYGTLSGSRRMAFIVQTGVPGCGIGAPRVVLEEVGVKPGAISKLAGGIGGWLQGVPWAQTTIPVVSVGPVVQDKIKAWQNAMGDAEMWRHGVRRDAFLSHDFFVGMRVTIDWDARQLVFEDD